MSAASARFVAIGKTRELAALVSFADDVDSISLHPILPSDMVVLFRHPSETGRQHFRVYAVGPLRRWFRQGARTLPDTRARVSHADAARVLECGGRERGAFDSPPPRPPPRPPPIARQNATLGSPP